MTKIALVALLFLSAHAWAGGDTTADGYTIKIHVSSSNIGSVGRQDLSVVIDGKKYELLCECSTGTLLALGDYKAKLIKDEHKTFYETIQVYDFSSLTRKPEGSMS